MAVVRSPKVFRASAPSVDSVANLINSHASRLSLQVLVIPMVVPPQRIFPSGALIRPQCPLSFPSGSYCSISNATDHVAHPVKIWVPFPNASYHFGVHASSVSEVWLSLNLQTMSRECLSVSVTRIVSPSIQGIPCCSLINCCASASPGHRYTVPLLLS